MRPLQSASRGLQQCSPLSFREGGGHTLPAFMRARPVGRSHYVAIYPASVISLRDPVRGRADGPATH